MESCVLYARTRVFVENGKLMVLWLSYACAHPALDRIVILSCANVYLDSVNVAVPRFANPVRVEVRNTALAESQRTVHRHEWLQKKAA